MQTLTIAAAAMALSACATTSPHTGDEASLRAVDDLQRRMVMAKDIPGLEALAHPNLIINAPVGHVLTREKFFANMRNGEIAAEQFTRTPETWRITGNAAVIMGRETFTPVATSELGRIYGAVALNRRYTNLYVWDDGRWKWLGRQATVLAPPAK